MGMYIIIVGAGAIGCSLMQLALDEGHEVVLIERADQRAYEASQRFDALVLHADISQAGILEEADVEKADALVATTNDDATNLMVMFLGREYGVKKLVSLVDVKEHIGMFESLGVQTVVDPEKIVSQHLYGRLRNTRVDDVITLSRGEQVFEATVGDNSRLAGNTIDAAYEEGLFASEQVVVSLRRGDEVILVPPGDTTLRPGDHLVVFSLKALDEVAYTAFMG